MDRDRVVAALDEMAVLLELAEANPFEIAAFRNGARNLEDWPGDLDAAVAEGSLTEIDGIGKGIAAVVTDLVRDGRSSKHQALREQFPERILELTRVPGLGVKKIRRLYQELDVDGLDTLEQAARDGRIRALAGFGAKSEERILSGIERARRYLAER